MSIQFDELKNLRKFLRQQRRSLNTWQQKQSELKICRYFHRHFCVKSARHIGIYLHAFGEIHTEQLIRYCLKYDKKVYLPIICAINKQLRWVNISAQQYHQHRFVLHRLKMYEAKNHRGFAVGKLDIVFMPLLACDIHGMRLGLGGGYYDRTLAHASQRPYRIGLAHDFQYLTQILPYQTWDEPLDELWTPSKSYRFKRLKSLK